VGVAQFNMGLAKDFLRVLCENQEPDGKIPQFVCATWNRPGESQPPLIAWSAWMLYKQCGDVDFIREVYGPLCRMADWWFANRDADNDGVVEWRMRLESGWDDSPRFDNGPIAAVDLNSYLNREMRLLGRMAGVLGRDQDTNSWEKRASEHARRMFDRLFDREDNLFYDRLVSEDRLHKVLTPACFMPLWAQVGVPAAVAHEMIAKYLVNPKHFFGSRPFPVVAYSDPRHVSDKWWRGPVWPNIAWAMTEILRIHEFREQHKEAVKRLVDMMASQDELNEVYSSATGEPLGAPGLCWSDAVFMALARAEELGKG
jgi:putative isomerase